MPFPSTLSTFNRPLATDRLNSPGHSALHNTVSSALGQVEATIGIEGANSVIGTLMYNIRSGGSDGGGHIQSAVKGGTGQVSYTKGDLLVAQNASILAKLAVGSDGQVLNSDSSASTGVSWGAGARPTVRIYNTASIATWTRPSNLSYVIVEAWGGGGTGGCAASSSNIPGIASGGGSGAYARKFIPGSAILASQTIVIGAGGGAMITSQTIGSVGGTTLFGSILSVGGGGRGVSILGTNATLPGGTGGSVLIAGDINLNGQQGGIGASSTITNNANFGGVLVGQGGNPPLAVGFGGLVPRVDTNGVTGAGFGAGGSGANYSGGGATVGGAGANGLLIITEF